MSNALLNNLSLASPPLPPTSAIFAPLTVDSSNFDNALWRAGQTTSNSITTDDIANDSNAFSDSQSDQASNAWSTSSSLYSASSSEASDSSTVDQPKDNPVLHSRNWQNKSTNSSSWSQNSSSTDADNQPQSTDRSSSTSSTSKRSGNKSADNENDRATGANSSSATGDDSPQNNATDQTSGDSGTADNNSSNNATQTQKTPAPAPSATAGATGVTPAIINAQNTTAANTAANAGVAAEKINSSQAGTTNGGTTSAAVQPNSDASAASTHTSAGTQQVANPQIRQAIPAVTTASQTAASDQTAANQADKFQASSNNPATQLSADGQIIAENASAINAELPEPDGAEPPHGETTKPARVQQTHSDNSQEEQTSKQSLNSALSNIVTTAALNQPASILSAPVSLTTTPATTIPDEISPVTEKAAATHDITANKPASLPSATTIDFSNELTANASAHLPTGDSQVDASTAAQHATGTSIDQSRFVQRVANAFRAADDQGGEIRLRLSPPELGSLKVEVAVRNGVMIARLEAETPTVRSLLLDNLPALRERLAGQNIKVERFDVDLRQDARGQGSSNPSPNFSGSRQSGARLTNFNRSHATAVPADSGNTIANEGAANTADSSINVVV